MPVEKKLFAVLERALRAVDDAPVSGPRLVDDAGRLWGRAHRLLGMGLIDPANVQPDALELACYAIYLPLRGGAKTATARGKLGRTGLKDRSEQAAELLVGLASDHADEALLDRTTRVLQEIPQRKPALDEARLLADAINLEDFSVAGLFVQTIELARNGDGVLQLVDGIEKREQYGYWDARLKDGFHFEPVRKLARARLDHVRQVAALLTSELAEDAE
jgi:hypothetical protein